MKMRETGKTVLTMTFVLKQYGTALISSALRSEGLDGFVCTFLKRSEENRRLFPLGLNLPERGLLDWLKSLAISRDREFVDKSLSFYGLAETRKYLIDLMKDGPIQM